MKRALIFTLAVVVTLLAIVFSAINAKPAKLDLYVGAIDLPVGVLVLAAMLVGCLLAGAVLYAAVILPLRLQLAALLREKARAAASATATATAVATAPRPD
ncbi:MAG TPA: lipopolysaccharide assembly protein LapA domain-containing protein [Xanthomonadales bacterium]|nr:lipopolysaccharide assembly protein LapA domain-containing protein [Xanthomonadales bacterium]